MRHFIYGVDYSRIRHRVIERMATLDEERYLRNLLLLGKGTSFVLKSLVVQEVSRSGKTLENLLLNNRTLFNGILKEQRDILYPAPLTANADLTTWDLSLLLLVVKRLFYPALPPVIASQIAALKVFRDCIQGHPSKMSMDETEFLSSQGHLKGHLRTIAGYVNQSRQIDDIITRTATGNLDIESVFRYVKETHAFSSSFKLYIEERFKQQIGPLKSEVKNIKGCQDRISQTISKIRNQSVRKTKYDFTKDLNTILQAECENEEKQKKATDLLFDFVKIIQDDNTLHSDEIKTIISQRVEWYGEITFQLMDDLIEWFTDIDKSSDGIGKACLGSIILPIFCSSVTGCFTVLEYVKSSQCKEHLSRISTTVSTLLGFPCSFSWGVEHTSLQSVLASYCDDIGTESSKKKLKNLVLPIHVTDIEGLKNIWKMFGGQKKSRHLENISRTLSSMFDEDICVGTYVDKDQLLKTVQETGLQTHSSGNMNGQSKKELDYSADKEKLEDKQPTQLKLLPPHGFKESKKRPSRHIHLFGTVSNTGFMMTEREVSALISCNHVIRSSIEPVIVASVLYRNGVLTKYPYSIIKEMFSTDVKSEEKSDFLIRNIPICMNLEDFAQVLDECGYRKLARQLFLTYRTLGISYITKSTLSSNRTLHAYYSKLKWMIDNPMFYDRRTALRKLSLSLNHQMQMERYQTQRQKLADKCVLIKAAEIDELTLIPGGCHPKDVIFKEMKELVTETSNTSLSDVIYLGRLAYANVLAGNLNDCKDILVEAKCRAYNLDSYPELVKLLYLCVCCQVFEFEEYPSRELQKQIMLLGSIALECLENVDVNVANSLRQRFVLRMAFCLLGLGNRTNVIENSPIDKESLSQARYLLSHIDHTCADLGTMRSKMFYYVARARLSELTDNTSECIAYITKAQMLANEGHLMELTFIEKYYERIFHGSDKLTLLQNQTCRSEHCSLCKNDTCSCLIEKDHAWILIEKDEDMKLTVTKLVAKILSSFNNWRESNT
ncbi:uncharacterized protein LOC132713239 [Ruditapes philippinarum]|uniref:uncharacterized protein LOC132713239 n=1 Tax=Ruditapes philippinarum TaxID=129788 RepID=UPI00295B654A|nr:uncharacterized protein LOC132713239 [Ruditapes philippinarum]